MNSPQEFLTLLPALHALEARAFEGGGALATLVRTRGSTFRSPGARMLVLGDGGTVGSVAGGCPDRDVVERATEVIRTGRAEIACYAGASIFDPMLETGCGGEIEVLVEPLTRPEHLAFVRAVEPALRKPTRGFMATIFAQARRCLPTPRRLVWSEDCQLEDLGGRALSNVLIAHGCTVLDGPPVRLESIATEGGPVDALFERLRPPPALVVIGAGAVGIALARLAQELGWRAIVVDEGAERPPGLPERVAFVEQDPASLAGALADEPDACVVAATHHFARDATYLSALAALPLAYLGAIGSRARAARLRADTGLSRRRLHVPAGLALGGETPEAIALSVTAEIQRVLAKRERVAGGAEATSRRAGDRPRPMAIARAAGAAR